MMANISSVIKGASPRLGSSSSSMRGWAIKARPMASICCSPPDRVPAAWSRRSARRPKRWYTTCMRRATSFRPVFNAAAPSCKFSATVSCGKTSRPSGVSAKPWRTICTGVLPVTVRPSRKTSPAEGFMRPMMHFSRVVFPAPLAPTRATVSPDRWSDPPRTAPGRPRNGQSTARWPANGFRSYQAVASMRPR